MVIVGFLPLRKGHNEATKALAPPRQSTGRKSGRDNAASLVRLGGRAQFAPKTTCFFAVEAVLAATEVVCESGFLEALRNRGVQLGPAPDCGHPPNAIKLARGWASLRPQPQLQQGLRRLEVHVELLERLVEIRVVDLGIPAIPPPCMRKTYTRCQANRRTASARCAA